MRRPFALLLLLMGVALTPLVARSAPSTPVEVIKIEGAIDRPLLGYVVSRLDAAEAEGAVTVLHLNTSGTLDQDGVALAQRVATMRVPVIAWTGPAPSRASGAGMLLMYASASAAVYPGSQVGPLLPLDLAHPSAVPPDLTQTIEGWLSLHDRTADLEAPDGALTGQQAVDRGIAARGASSVTQLLDDLDGKTVTTVTGPVVLHTHVAVTAEEAQQGTVSIRFENLGPVRRIEHAVSTPSMIYTLLVLGFAGVAFELTQPGFGFAGASGVLLLALAFYGLTVVPVSILGLGLLIGAIVLLCADVLVRRLGVLTGLGMAAFIAGSILAWRGVAGPIGLSPWLVGSLSLASILYYGFALTVALQSRDRIVNTQRGLIGLVGETRGTLDPDGPVFVKGALWRGRSTNGEIAPGTKVRVRGVDGLILRVEPEPGSDP